jgi:hypothetical protein
MKALLLALGLLFVGSATANAENCSVESTGLKYTEVEGSGFASMFFVIPLLALAPLAGATDSTGQYRCHVAVIGADALGAKKKLKNRPQVEPQ